VSRRIGLRGKKRGSDPVGTVYPFAQGIDRRR
jgi:hypothetical protein